MASRKLQGEIERVLKKVDEGVHVFEQIWDKVYSAATTAQKEKYEGDLKKEIKKLQRLRDQIKTWQGDNSIKDKTKLNGNRKLIEEKMEKFKICEKETKTKAFSKEGLAQDRTDPKQKAKAGVGEWVSDALTKLKEQSDEMEAEIETLNSGKRKKRGEENPRVTQLKENITRHEYHVEMLERVLRAVYNDAVTPEEASDLQESVDYYIESNHEPDFYEDDEMYDSLNLDSAPVPSTSVAKKVISKGGDKERDDDDDANSSHGSSMHVSSSSVNKKGPASPRNTKSTRATPVVSSTKPTTNTPVSARVVSPKKTRANDTSPTVVAPQSPRNPSTAVSGREGNDGKTIAAAPLMSTVVKGSTVVNPPEKAVPVALVHAHAHASTEGSTSIGVQHAKVQRQVTDAVSHDRVAVGTIGVRQPQEDDVVCTPPKPKEPSIVGEEGIVTKSIPKRSVEVVEGKVNSKTSSMDSELAAVEAALLFMPEGVSCQKSSCHSSQHRSMGNGSTASGAAATPRHPIKVPASFPSVSAPVFDGRDVFEQFDPDTLFFIFYYQQGTYQQYLAATELKRKGWRFHKKYLTWFQRHEEPKRSTDEYETGTFIYFDYANVVVHGQGTGWCQRIKSEFVFEYRFLEDELV